MSTWIFVYNVVFSALAVAVAFLPLAPRQSSGSTEHGQSGRCSPKLRRALICVLIGALIPVMATGVFGLYPSLALAVIELDTYARMEWEYWLPFAVLMFAVASHLVPRRSRRALVLLSCAVAIFAVQQKAWHVVRPAAYDLEGTSVDGVCFQSTGYTCGAASAVTLLNTMGIEATEGEMAELMRTPPRHGITSVGAAYGLKRKLARESCPERVTLAPCGKDNLDDLPTPFLVGLKFKLWCDHMVCVLEVGPDRVVVGDPLVGIKVWPRKAFEDEVRGLAVLVEP